MPLRIVCFERSLGQLLAERAVHNLDVVLCLPAESLRNVHLEDGISGGCSAFDYVLRDGPVTRSNGVELMRSIGLDVWLRARLRGAVAGAGSRRYLRFRP